MQRDMSQRMEEGRSEFSEPLRRSRALLWSTFLFSAFVNLLMLTGPIYMLQVYDRVLGSRSEETLVALSILVTFLFLMMGLLDHARGRVMARVAARLQSTLDGRVFRAHLRRAAALAGGGAKTPLRDLESVQKLMSSPVFLALFDVPWTPLFIAAIFIFHPWLGWLAVGGGAILVIIALVNQATTAGPMARASQEAARADVSAQRLASDAELVRSLGMQGNAYRRWLKARGTALEQNIAFSDRSGGFTVTTKTMRLFLQSAMLGLGAYLVLQDQLTAGAMIAGSILLGRALAPIEMVIGQWQMIYSARRGRRAVIDLLAQVPPEPARTPLPRPRAILSAENVTVIPPGAQQASLRAVSFTLRPGQAMGVIGPSGAGKSSLARAVTGAWAPAGGKIRLDAATLDQYDPDVLGGHVGYLPQTVTLFDGTVAENIARLSPEPDAAKVVEAAKKAAVHEMIVNLPRGYDTPVSATGSMLSGGQIQRVGLARAMYGDPVLLVLDEPNSNLDNMGTQALNEAIREMKARGGAVIIIAHRPAAIQECEVLLMLEGGMRTAFGPREQVMRERVKNHAEIARSAVPGGVR
jgi:ATP-binding cassette subfamily C protein